MDVLLVAAKRDLVDDYVQVIQEAGLTPTAVDVAAFAVENAFEMNYEAEGDEVVALVNIGAQVVNINVIQNGVPVFTRDITTGGNQYTEEIQKSLSISFEEAERIIMDSDGIKTLLPEWQGWNAGELHLESSYLFDEITKIARRMNFNVVHDMTLKNARQAVERMNLFSDAGRFFESALTTDTPTPCRPPEYW